MNIKKINPERKLKYLSSYMGEWIDAWPNKIKPFPIWLESQFDRKITKGVKAHIESLKKVCCYCKRSFEENCVDKTKDHVIPISKGGLNVKENKRPCCYDCNQWKGDKMPQEWLDDLQYFVKNPKKIFKPHDKNTVGVMIGNLKRVINEIKQHKKKVSEYNF